VLVCATRGYNWNCVDSEAVVAISVAFVDAVERIVDDLGE
jgi:hypothetical protein